VTAPERPGRRQRVMLFAAVAAAAALAVGIPAGLAAAPDEQVHVLPTATPTDTPESTVDVPPETTPAPETASETASETAEPPSSLTGAQQELWQDTEKDGLDGADCVGYPVGEQEFAGVVAALACPVEDPTIEQPAYLYQFDGASSLGAYLDHRAGAVDRVGDCAEGDETDGTWSTSDGRDVGRIVCVDNPKDGTVYFKIAFAVDADAIVAVIQDESPSDAYTWWEQHADGQFYGVGTI
jgi:hypothetical protein